MPPADVSARPPTVNLADDDFSLMGLPARFDVDRALLDARWKALQAQVHPDRFVGQDAGVQRLAMQQSVRVNEAYRRLREPLSRAAYLCELLGSPVQAERNTHMPAAFLMQQIEWREALDEATTLQSLETLASAVRQERQALLKAVAVQLDEVRDVAAAAKTTRCLMFIDKFLADVDVRSDALS
jgi:molecular chaperone HscB